MRRLLVRRKKFFFVGGIVALLVVAGAVLVNKLQPQEANATGSRTVNLKIGYSATGTNSYFSIDNKKAWCVTPSYADPRAGSHEATVYNLDDLKSANSGKALYIKRMFIAYYYANENVDHDENHSTANNDGMHWALSYLYSGNNEYPADGVNARAIFDFYKKGFPSNLESASVTLIPENDRNEGGQAIFSADYRIKTTKTQKVTIKKVWKDGLDGDDHDVSIQYELIRSGSVIKTGFLNKDNNWQDSYEYEINAGDNPPTYKVREIIINSGSGGFVIENVGGVDMWHHPSIDRNNNNETIYYPMPSSDGVSCTASSDGLTNTCTLVNKSKDVTKVNLSTIKHWDDSGYANSYRPSEIKYTVHAFIERNGSVEMIDRVIWANDKIGIKRGNNSNNEWRGYIAGLVRKAYINNIGYDVTYAIEEDMSTVPAAYRLECKIPFTYNNKTYCLAELQDPDDEESDYEVNWTNSIEKITVTAKKHWNDGGNKLGKRLSMVGFRVFRNGEKYRDYYMSGDGHALNWEKNIKLVKKDPDGNDYVYTYQEIEYYERVRGEVVAKTSDYYDMGDNTELGFDNTGANAVGMVNTAKTNIPVKKCWIDKDASKRPDSVTFKLYQGDDSTTVLKSIVLTSENAGEDGCWTGEFKDLPAYDDDGNAITYHVIEATSLGASYRAEATTCTVDIEDRVDNNDSDMSCDFVNYQLIDIPVKKCWVDKDASTRPGKLVFELYQDNSTTAYRPSLELTSNNADDDGCWTGTFRNLPAYIISNKRPHTYTVKEVLTDIDNYVPEEENGDSCTINIASNSAWNNGLTCSFTNVELIDIPVKKVWAEDKKEDRPGSIEVSLLCGEDVLDTVTLSEENNLDGDNTWEYTWTNRRVDECEQGYSIAENINVPGYTSKITGNAEDGFVITNTKTLDEILTWGSLGAGSFGAIVASFFVVKRKFFSR